MSITRNFNLYLNAGKSIPSVINVNQYDHDEQWVFTLYTDNGTKYVPSSGSIVGIKSDGNGIINTATVNASGQVVVNETEQMTAAAGVALYELQIDNGTHGTANFKVLVEPKPGDNATISDSQISLIEQAIEASSHILDYGSPLVASTVAGMTDQNRVYVYTGTETGYTAGNWYYYDGSAWVSGGVYNAVAVQTDPDLDTAGMAADAKATGDAIRAGTGGGLTADIKAALMDFVDSVKQLATKVAYIDANGQDYYDDIDDAGDALYSALYPPANLSSITAVYTQSGTVYATDPLDSLKTDLVVTAHYSDLTSSTVASEDYTLSGTLTTGTSTVTVTYNGKTTTFTVTVSASPYVQTGLIHQWDALNNTGSGYDATATVWKDLVGNLDLTKVSGGVWNANNLEFHPSATTDTQCWTSASALDDSTNMTIEICMTPTTDANVEGWENGKAAVIGFFKGYGSSKNRCIAMSRSDQSVSGYCNATNNFAPCGLTNGILDIKSIVATYNATTNYNNIYVNGTAKTKSANHTYGANQATKIILGGYGTIAGAGSNAYPYLGKIYAIRIYSRELTAAEVSTNYNADLERYSLE